jgi:hypothetical protein
VAESKGLQTVVVPHRLLCLGKQQALSTRSHVRLRGLSARLHRFQLRVPELHRQHDDSVGQRDA